MAKIKVETPQKVWSALNGRCMGKTTKPGNTGHKPKVIPIKENCRSVNMEAKFDALTGKKPADPYGIPITAALAISLIADFQDLIKPLQDVLIDNQFDSAFERLFDGYAKELDSAAIKKIKDSFGQLLYRSSAITIDKNVLLKTLSQPGCEGLRFYLCKKTEKVLNDDGKPEDMDFISLVTIGVNSVGHDLNYEYKPGVVKTTVQENAVETQSMISEYGSPPPPPKTGGGTIKKQDLEEYEKKFVLLKYARDRGIKATGKNKKKA